MNNTGHLIFSELFILSEQNHYSFLQSLKMALFYYFFLYIPTTSRLKCADRLDLIHSLTSTLYVYLSANSGGAPSMARDEAALLKSTGSQGRP